MGALTGSSSLDWLSPDDRHAARLGFQALADGDLTGYQAIRGLANRRDTGQVFSVWVSAVDVDGARVGLASIIPFAEHDNQFRALPPVSDVPEPGSVVLGTIDGSWRVDRISQDVTPLLGLTPEQCAGRPALGVLHPFDLPAFTAAVEHARRGERGPASTAAGRPAAAAKASVTGSECRNGGSVNAKRGRLARSTASHAS